MYLVSFYDEVLTLISEMFGLSVQGTAPYLIMEGHLAVKDYFREFYTDL